MNTSQEVLFKLIRIALGNETDFSLPNVVDWREVIELSWRHGLPAIAIDGLQLAFRHNPELLSLFNSPELEELKYNWFGQTLCVEYDYLHHMDVLGRLLDFNKKMEIRTFLFKGYGLSLDYPISNHRSSGDFDVYYYSRGDYADRMVDKHFGVKVKQNEDKHSTFTFEDILVENHASFTNTVEYPRHLELEKFLLSEADKALTVDYNGIDLFLPTVMFNSVFLPCHIAGHLVYGGISLKQFADWAVFVGKHHGEIDWDKVFELADNAGYLPFLKCLNGIVVQYLGVGKECVPDDFGYNRVQNRVLEELFSQQVDRTDESYFGKVKRYFASKWKYELVFKENYYLTFFKHSWASFRGRFLKNSRNVWA